ncbi:hypothetical protein BJ742DRAFT_454559 [Cladochytrium replicatum]|nr:hypothetical protein BJ742DRAFT_454559 [Cladochytrium replicatum]
MEVRTLYPLLWTFMVAFIGSCRTAEPQFDLCECLCCRLPNLSTSVAGNSTILSRTGEGANTCSEEAKPSEIPSAGTFRLSEYNTALCVPKLCNINFPDTCPSLLTEPGVVRVVLTCSGARSSHNSTEMLNNEAINKACTVVEQTAGNQSQTIPGTNTPNIAKSESRKMTTGAAITTVLQITLASVTQWHKIIAECETRCLY